MSPLDVPLGLTLVALGVGSLVGIVAFAAAAELFEWMRRDR
ncbi:hypothetical protein [Brachybacterium sp. SGAir0954]|nr:hypothetical protein [Brachybacterium sp. SGAir0954]